jgi:hypothetical protein
MLHGHWERAGDVVQLISAPQVTYDALIAAGLIVRRAAAQGLSAEETLERVAEHLPEFGKFKGYAKIALVQVALWALGYLAEKALDTVVDPIIKPDDTPQVIERAVKDAVEKAFEERRRAEKAAGVEETRVPVEAAATPPSLKLSYRIQIPQAPFPKKYPPPGE